MIIFLRSNECNPDPRLQKYLDYLEKKEIEYKVLAWDRNKTFIKKEKFEFFRMKANYGDGYKNIFKKICWFLFIIKYLLVNKKKYKVIHACDVDTCLPAYLFKFLFNKKIIFDVFDVFYDKEKKGIVNSLLGISEKFLFKNCDKVILCEKERLQQFSLHRDDALIMPNIPKINFKYDAFVEKEILKQKKNNNKFILSYIGVFDLDRGIENLLDVVSNNKNLILNIGGFGKIEDLVIKYSNEFENIIYWGKVDYNIGLNIMKHSDLIVAMYYKTNPIHKYAAPNKYYEGLFLGKAILTTKDTLVGNKTLLYKTGFIIGEDLEELEVLFNICKNELLKQIYTMNINAHNLWLNEYQDYIEKFMENKYLVELKC